MGKLLGETGGGALGMVAADVVAAGGALALGLPLALAASGDDMGALAGVFVGAFAFVALDLLLTPPPAVLAVRLVDREHAGAEERPILPVLALAYGAKLLALGAMVGATALGASLVGEVGAMLGLGVGLLLNFVGVPAAISLALHAQDRSPEAVGQERSPVPWKTFQPMPPPPPPLPGASRTIVFPLLSANF